MGYVVLHIQKGQGGDSKMSSHIERKNHPANADETRTHLNKELIDFPEGVKDRTQAIQHRIENANITRKIGKNQVRAIRIMLSGSAEDMKRIQESGKLDNWCKDSLDWVRDTFGKDNLVSAVLHKDEKTPHIHATVVPIVTGERRKVKDKKQEDNPNKKKYRKKHRTANRLCVDDVISQAKLTEFQDTYAEKMKPYGLERGVRGSEARHITTAQYYRDIFKQVETAKEQVGLLEEEKLKKQQTVKELKLKEGQEIERLSTVQRVISQKEAELGEKEKQLSQVKKEVLEIGFEKSAKSAGKELMDGIGKLMGNPKAKRLETELSSLKDEVLVVKTEKDAVIKEAEIIIFEKERTIQEKDKLIHSQQTKLENLFDCLPILKEYDFILRLCEVIKIPFDIVKQLFSGKKVSYSGELYSPEHKQHFEAKEAVLSIAKNPKDSKLCLAIDSAYYTQWFKDQKTNVLESMGIKINESKRQRGLGR